MYNVELAITSFSISENRLMALRELVLMIVQLALQSLVVTSPARSTPVTSTRRAWITLLAPDQLVQDLICLPGLGTRTTYHKGIRNWVSLQRPGSLGAKSRAREKRINRWKRIIYSEMQSSGYCIARITSSKYGLKKIAPSARRPLHILFHHILFLLSPGGRSRARRRWSEDQFLMP